MKRFFVTCLVFVVAMALGFGNALAQPSAKATCQAGDLSVVEFASAAPVFTQTIHTASQKDLFIDVSMECGLTTNTKVMSKALKRAISEAEAYVKVWVTVDGDVAAPGVVTFARRYQGLIAEFAGSFVFDPENCPAEAEIGNWQDCFVTDPLGITTIHECCLTEEMLALILDTMTANSFNFVFNDLEAGDHEVVVWADVDYEQTGDQYVDDKGELSLENIATRAYLGNGSVTVESVRMVKGEDVELQ